MAKWTIEDIPSQKGRLAVVTGASSGIGWETALELARAECEVILTVRTEDKGRDAIERIRQILPHSEVRAAILDLSSQRSVRAFAALVRSEAKLDLLVNNAGIMAVPRRTVTEDGFEAQLATNFLGPFALTMLLLPALRRAPSPRVTTVASLAANRGNQKIDFKDVQGERSYRPWKAYCQSKLANLLFTLELGRRCAAANIDLLSNAAHPGYARTNLHTSGPGRPQNLLQLGVALLFAQDAAPGAWPILRAATAEEAAPGSYYGPRRMLGLKGAPVPVPIPRPARDPAAAKKLWDLAENLTGAPFSSST